MFILSPFFRFGSPLEAPVLTLITGSSDNTPDFVLTGDLAELDTVRFQYDDDPAFGSPTAVTNTIDAGEDAANALSFATGTLANGTWYFRARIERPPKPFISAWSNTETVTLTGFPAGVRSLFGRWLGGFSAPSEANGGYRSLFGRWLGGFSSGQAAPPVEETPRRGGAFYPTKKEIARNKVRQRQIGSLFATPLSWLDKAKTKEERVELIQELEEAVQEAAAEARPRIQDVPAVPPIDWEAVARRKRDYERIGRELEETLERIDLMIEAANEEDDIEILLLS